MKNFVYENRTKVIFGKDSEKEAGREMAKYGKRILLHHSGGHVKSSGLLDRVKKSLESASLEWVELSGVKPNPVLSLVHEGVELCRKEKIDAVLAVGGGSVIDSAKAIALGVPYDGDVWDFFVKKGEPKNALPVGDIVTISAAGSETSFNLVITNEDGLVKIGAGYELVRPRFAIMNPELTYSLPPYQSACGIADIMAHVMERYFTKTPNVELTDELCEATLRTVIRNARVVMKDPKNYDARAEIMWAGSLAHNGLLGTGRVEDWGSHRVEHELSALYDIAHGAGLSIIFPVWMEYCLKEDPRRMARFARKVFGVDGAYYDYEQAAREGIFRLREFFRSLGLPVSFKDAGIPTDKISEMAQKMTARGPQGQYKVLQAADAEAIYRMAAEVK